MKTISLFLLSSVTYGALASRDPIDVPKDIDISYNKRLDELLKVQNELQAALNTLLSSPALNEDDSQEDLSESKVEKREEELSESKVEKREEVSESKVEKREELSESKVEKREELSESKSLSGSKSLSAREDEESHIEEETQNAVEQREDDMDAQVEPIEKPKDAVIIQTSDDTYEEYSDLSTEVSTSIPKVSSLENTRPKAYLKDIKPSDLPRAFKDVRGYDGLSYQVFKPTRIVFPRSTFQQEYSYPAFNSTPNVGGRTVTKQSIEDSQRELRTFRGGASQSKIRRSKMGQYLDAAAYWKTLREQAVIQPPLAVYVDVKAIENSTDTLTRMHVRTSSQNKADMIQLSLQRSLKGSKGEVQELKEAEAAALAAIGHFAHSRSDILTIRHYYDHMKHHTVHTALNLQLGPILGRGGNAIVLQATAADRFTQTILGAQRVAIKVLYVERHRTPDMTEGDYLSLFKEEVHVEATPANYAARSGQFDSAAALNEKGGFLTFKMSSDLSQYTDGEIVLCDGYVFYSKVLIFEKMLIDVRSLVLPSPMMASKYNSRTSMLSMDERLYIAKQMLLRVAAFHSMGLVHYDIKPANFLISTNGNVVLSDFGFAAPAGSPMECGSNCTPKYQDPETAACTLKNKSLSRDFEYDSWSLGLSMYYVITNGEYPFNIGRKHNILKGLSEFLEQDPQEVAFYKGEAVWQTMERLGVPNYLSHSITLLLQTRRQDRPTPLQLLSMYSEYLNGS